MNELKILLVEDATDQQKIFIDTVDVFNSKNEGAVSVKYEVSPDLDDAEEKIDGNYDGAIIDLQLGDDVEGGNKLVDRISASLIRVPVVFVSAHPESVKDHPLIIKKRARGSESYEVDLNLLLNIQNTGLTNIMGGRGEIERALNQVYINNLLPQNESWISYGEQDSAKTERALLRHTLNHLLHILDDSAEESYPEEFYLNPPLTEMIKTGSIVNDKSTQESWVVVSPACDLVLRADGKCKTDNILIAKIDPHEYVFVDYPATGLSNSQKGQLKTAYKNNKTDFYHWLPPANTFGGGFLNFRKIKSIERDAFTDLYKTPDIQITSSFIKDVISRFSSYYARQGQPTIDFSKLIPS